MPGWPWVFDRLISVSEANMRGLSRLVADAEAGHEWVILRGGKPAACVVGIDVFRDLEALDRVERTSVTFLLGLLRYSSEATSARLLEWQVSRMPMSSRDTLPVLVAETAHGELDSLALSQRLLVEAALRDLTVNPEAGTSCGGAAPDSMGVQIRLLEFGPFWVSYAWHPTWWDVGSGPCVVEVVERGARGRFERLNESIDRLARRGWPTNAVDGEAIPRTSPPPSIGGDPLPFVDYA